MTDLLLTVPETAPYSTDIVWEARDSATAPMSRIRARPSEAVETTRGFDFLDSDTFDLAGGRLVDVLWWDAGDAPSRSYDADLQARRFQNLTDTWRGARGPASSVAKMAMHPAYQQIIGMGERALPLILRELEREPDHWFWALQAITGEDPVPEAARGRLPEMARAWLRWAAQRNIEWKATGRR